MTRLERLQEQVRRTARRGEIRHHRLDAELDVIKRNTARIDALEARIGALEEITRPPLTPPGKDR